MSGFCAPCDENCLTCGTEPDECQSCVDSKVLKSSQCFSRLVVNFLYEFGFDFDEFLENGNSEEIIARISEVLGVDVKNIMLNGLS